MTEEYENDPGPCGGGDCDFTIDPDTGQVACAAGGGSCSSAEMAEAEISTFHDQTLADATRQIKQILDGLPTDDPRGRKVSFLRTPRGMMLAWVNHGEQASPDAVPWNADEETLAQALKLKPASAADGGS
jgi:hypothetical protein